MQKFLKAHRVFIIGLCLPLLLGIIFAGSAFFPKNLTPLPQYDVLFMTIPYPHDGISTQVIDNQLTIFITAAVRKGTLPLPHLFQFHAKTHTIKEIPIELPMNTSNHPLAPKEALMIPHIQNVKIDPNQVASDGYKADLSSPYDNNIMSLFVSNNPKRSLNITKNGKTFIIADETNNPYGDKSIKFLGWIIEK